MFFILIYFLKYLYEMLILFELFYYLAFCLNLMEYFYIKSNFHTTFIKSTSSR